MTQEFDLKEVARQMKAAQDQARQLPLWTSQWSSFDTAAGYDVLHLIHQARMAEGALPVGRKIGFTNDAVRAQFGASESMWAYVYDTTLLDLSTGSGQFSLGRLVDPKIEPEIVIHFRSAPPVTDDLTAILACVDWIAHSFEIVQAHFPDSTFRFPDTIADSGLHGALLLGERHDVRELGADAITALGNLTVRLLCNGEERAAGKGANVLGNPLAAIAHLLAVTARQGERARLQAGEMVTTGSLTAALPIHAGQIWTTELSGIPLPGLRVQFVE